MAAAVARQPAPASMMARVDRLDLLLGYLEEMHMHRSNASPNGSASTTASSPPSTPAAVGSHHGLVMSSDEEEDDSSAASTPRGSKSWRRRRPRPAKEVLEEARAKGSLIDRIAFLEHRVLKVKMEEDMEMISTPAANSNHQPRAMSNDPNSPSSMMMMMEKNKTTTTKKKKKGLKSLVKSCVRGNLKTKD